MPKEIKKTVYLLLFLTLILSATPFRANALQSSTSLQSNGIIRYSLVDWLHTEGQWIKDESGNIVTLKGTTRMEMSWWAPPNALAGPISLDGWIAQMKSYGVQVIRIDLSSCVESGWKNRWGDPAYRALLDDIVRKCSEQGIYVILAWETPFYDPNHFDSAAAFAWMRDPSAIETWMNWWEEITTRYRYDSNVAIFGLSNELIIDNSVTGVPLSVIQAEWKTIVTECARRIHTINPNILILVCGSYPGKLQPNFVTDPIDEPNIIYDIHLYYHFASWENWYSSYQTGNFALAKQQLEAYFINYCIHPTKPVFFGEIGANHLDTNWEQQIIDMYNLLAKYNVGWCYFVWYPGGGMNGGLIENDWTTLTPQGQLWSQYVR